MRDLVHLRPVHGEQVPVRSRDREKLRPEEEVARRSVCSRKSSGRALSAPTRPSRACPARSRASRLRCGTTRAARPSFAKAPDETSAFVRSARSPGRGTTLPFSLPRSDLDRKPLAGRTRADRPRRLDDKAVVSDAAVFCRVEATRASECGVFSNAARSGAAARRSPATPRNPSEPRRRRDDVQPTRSDRIGRPRHQSSPPSARVRSRRHRVEEDADALPWRRAACQRVSARIGAKKPRSSREGLREVAEEFDTIPVFSGRAP